MIVRPMLVLLGCAAGVFDPEPVSGAGGEPRGPLQLRWPLEERELFKQTVGVDHDPVQYEEGSVDGLICTNYDGRTFPWCYDEHRGSDYLLEGGFDQMDDGSATIVAAAAGMVVQVEDGHYDRCHGEVGGVDCDGYDGVANSVIMDVVGSDGLTYRTLYWHLMSGSLKVAVGDSVGCGDPIGLVGSSGNSSQPHLHFQVEAMGDIVVDPYAGVYSQPETWWLSQGSATSLPGSDCPELGLNPV